MLTTNELTIIRNTKDDTEKSLLNYIAESELKFDHCLSRVKSMSSATNKLERKGLEMTPENIMTLTDIIGIRIVTHYIDEINSIVNVIKKKFTVVKESDYISHPKPSGYRSYHIIIEVPVSDYNSDYRFGKTILVEIQIRTMGMDYFASLEHLMKYKKVDCNEIVSSELLDMAKSIWDMDIKLQGLKALTNKD